MEMKCYVTEKKVRAFKIGEIMPLSSLGDGTATGFVIKSERENGENGITACISASVWGEFLQKFSVKVGDWYVWEIDGSRCILPQEYFESHYKEVSDQT